MRFIGTQRPSMAMENEVSTSSATAACVRASVSRTSMSSGSSRIPAPGSPPSPAVRVIALVTVRGTSHDSTSPNSHSRLAPDCSPAAPDMRVSLAPVRPDSLRAASRSRDLPSLRTAAGDSLRFPSGRLLR